MIESAPLSASEGRCARPLFGLIGAGALLVAVPLSASAAPRPPAPLAQPPVAAAPKFDHIPPSRLPKFEARRLRHACRDKADEQGLKDLDRDAFVLKCFFGQVSQRALRRDCAKGGESKGLDRNALADFVRECVKIRANAGGGAYR